MVRLGRGPPLIELLENRRLLACDVSLTDRRLLITGDRNDNQIAIVGARDQVLVTCDGNTTRWPSNDVDDVKVHGSDGNDSISVADLAAAFQLFGDDGDDSMYIDVN